MDNLPSPKEGYQWLSKNQAIGYFDKSAPTLDQSIKWWEAHPEDEDSFRVARLGRNVFVEVPKPKNPLDNKIEELVNKIEGLTKEKELLAKDKDSLEKQYNAINNDLSTTKSQLAIRIDIEKELKKLRKRNEELEKLENSWLGGKLHRLFNKPKPEEKKEKEPDIPPS